MSPPPPTELRSPRFHAFLLAQFLGAANDNAFKVTLVLWILATVSDEATQVFYASLVTALFPIPFLLFSPIAGYLADRYAKHRVLFWTKVPEIAAMGLATVGFAGGHLPLLLFALFLMATHSAFFSPAKYGIFPEIFANENLSLANGILELTTNLAILAGSIAGVYVYGTFKGHLSSAGLTYVGVAALGTAAIALAPRAPAGNPQARFVWNLLASAASDWREMRKSRVLSYTLLGIAYFGFLGSLFLTVIPVYGKNILHLREEHAGILLAVLSIGVGAGSLIAGRLSRGHVEIGLVPLGSLGISLCAFDLGLASGGGSWRLPFGIPARAALDLVLLGLASGFFIVPLNALLQQRSPEGMKGRFIAFSNVLTFAAVLCAAGVPWLLSSVMGLSTAHVILSAALLTVAGSVYVMNLLPDFLVRLVLWLLTNTIYRVRSVGAENIPRQGALFVANHTSWVDFLLIGAACDRMIRFLMFRKYYEWPPIHWFLRRMGAIPVAAGDPPKKTEESLAIARRQIADGHVVCIFAEGSITRTGNLLKFKRGFERIAAHADCPIVPVYVEGIWGSIFSYEGGKFFLKWPKGIRRRITVTFGAPMPSSTNAFDVRQRIQELSTEAFAGRKEREQPLGVELVRAARRYGRRPLLVDTSRSLGFTDALARATALRRVWFGDSVADGEAIGILLPAGVEAALANFAIALAGRVAVNLDATPPGEIARAMIGATGVSTVITRRSYLESLRFDASLGSARVVDIEESARAAPPSWTTRAVIALLPAALAARFLTTSARNVDRVATVLFSYPPQAPTEPRGALLSHHNVLANLEALRQVLDVSPEDAILGLLPFSNAMSFATTLWLPVLSGARAVYADPANGLGELCARGVTLLAVTPPLLDRITGRVGREQLSSLRFAAVGGEALTDESRHAFAAKFGVEPAEGYGRPECAPIVSLNVPDVAQGKNRQTGSRRGTTGHPLPGISLRIIDAQTGSALPPGSDGILCVRGPNVMRGYADRDGRAPDPFRDGWYVTGDGARLDDDGFLTVYYPR